MGRLDGSVPRDEALEHAATIVEATELPVSANLENAYAHEPDGVAETVEGAFAAYGALVEAATELRDQGTYGYAERSAAGVRAVRAAFG